MIKRLRILLLLPLSWPAAHAKKDTVRPASSPLDQYIEEAMGRTRGQDPSTSGSTWSPAARFSDLSADLRASRVDDIVTILVAERASAVAKGSAKAARTSSAKSSIDALGGVTKKAGPWPNLAKLSTQSQMDGEGATTRETTLSTTLTARVTHVLPNGNLVVEGVKNLTVNSENQLITVRGIVRPVDLSTANMVRSERLGQMEVRVNGKGLVGDAVRRPFILYRILLGLLPF
ncbi:MAG: flagellar basal body L-ring protein FlgH [Candidatus Solibacter usitatus]|nr:flagellar basal body L-ring protein FlgH [Candidatus Solibacter usitatus]